MSKHVFGTRDDSERFDLFNLIYDQSVTSISIDLFLCFQIYFRCLPSRKIVVLAAPVEPSKKKIKSKLSEFMKNLPAPKWVWKSIDSFKLFCREWRNATKNWRVR